MRFTFTVSLLSLGLLAGCGSQTPAEKAAAKVCLMDTAGVLLTVVPGTIDASGKVTAQTAIPAAGVVLKSALSDPNCAAAILAAEAPAKSN